MAKHELALLGGPKTIDRAFKLYNSYGEEETKAATAVVSSGQLSRFIGVWHADFFGGPKVQEFERAWEAAFETKHAVTMNSATSCLVAAVGALGLEPGDEVIVSPWTMCASATAIIVWNCLPVFADIDPDTFNLDPRALESLITPRTKAIMVPDIFGQSANLNELMAIAKKHGLKVIEDASQAPGARYQGKHVGTIADIGVYSLNYHKHIHTGEGGVCVTNSPEFAERMQLIRNHAEAVVAGKGGVALANMIGFNFRLGEVEAAMGIEQLKKLPRLSQRRSDIGQLFTEGLKDLRGLTLPIPRSQCTHVYYMYSMILDVNALGISRARLLQALEAEGVTGVRAGYVNVHRLPMYQQKIAFGSGHYPWTLTESGQKMSYAKGICPVAEKLHDETMISIAMCLYEYDDADVHMVIKAFQKVWANLEALR